MSQRLKKPRKVGKQTPSSGPERSNKKKKSHPEVLITIPKPNYDSHKQKKNKKLTFEDLSVDGSHNNLWRQRLNGVMNPHLVSKHVKSQENAIWLAVLLCKLFISFFEVVCMIVMWIKNHSSRIFFETLPAYGSTQNSSFNSLLLISIFINLFIICIAFYSKHIVIWSKASIIPRSGVFLCISQVVVLFLAFIFSSLSYANLENTLRPSNFLLVTDSFHENLHIHYYIDQVQLRHECCGIRGPYDWVAKKTHDHLNTTQVHLPLSCCDNATVCTYSPTAVGKNAFEQGCYVYLVKEIMGLIEFRCYVYGLDLIFELPVLLLLLLALPDLSIMAILNDTIDYMEEEGMLDKLEEENKSRLEFKKTKNKNKIKNNSNNVNNYQNDERNFVHTHKPLSTRDPGPDEFVDHDDSKRHFVLGWLNANHFPL